MLLLYYGLRIFILMLFLNSITGFDLQYILNCLSKIQFLLAVGRKFGRVGVPMWRRRRIRVGLCWRVRGARGWVSLGLGGSRFYLLLHRLILLLVGVQPSFYCNRLISYRAIQCYLCLEDWSH